MFLNNIKSNSVKSLAVFAALIVLTNSASFAQNENSNGNNEPKVAICHKQGNDYSDMEVPERAVDGHLGHGDYLGVCETPSVPEFGLLAGILAGAGSAGSYLLLKKRAANI